MTIELAALLAAAGATARRMLIDEGAKTLVGMYHLVAPEGGTDVILLCSWRNEVEKMEMIARVKAAARKLSAVAAMFCSEGWMVQRDAPLERLLAEDPPSQQPDRIECVIAAATDGTSTAMKIWRVMRSRPGGGRVIDLVEEEPRDGTFESRFVDGIIPRKSAA